MIQTHIFVLGEFGPQMRSKYDIYFVFASFLIPIQIFNFCKHLLQLCLVCKNIMFTFRVNRGKHGANPSVCIAVSQILP